MPPDLTERSTHPKTGLILTGGGARAAYQVGVLRAIGEIQSNRQDNPFKIICGTSAGAVNAAALAAFADNFEAGIEHLLGVWSNFRANHVYRSDPAGIAKGGAQWLASLMLVRRTSPVSFLDNEPLARMLSSGLDFSRIQQNIDRGFLYAISITCSGYSSGQSVSFYQGGTDCVPWERTQRVGCAMPINVEHLMASSALPFIFPPVRINREFFGDGSMRQIAPISPALHLGADRVLVIGTGRQSVEPPRVRSMSYPSLAQIAGHALNSIFLDSLNVDIERLQRINRTISLIPPDTAREAGLSLRKIDVMVISPSEPIERIAVRYLNELPRSVRFLLRGVGAMNRNGSNLASYLLFERGFCRALIDLGYRDTMARKEEMKGFLSPSPAVETRLR